MFKTLLVSGAVVSAAALGSPAISGPLYLNPEANVGAGKNGVTSATVDLHIGAKADGFFGQIGPMLSVPDTGDTTVGVSGKAGYSFGAGYSELSFSSIDNDTTWNLKVGKSLDL